MQFTNQLHVVDTKQTTSCGHIDGVMARLSFGADYLTLDYVTECDVENCNVCQMTESSKCQLCRTGFYLNKERTKCIGNK